MSLLLLGSLFMLSSIVAGTLALRHTRLGDLRHAATHALEFVGLWATCLMVNVGLGCVFILSLRAFTRAFVSIYVLDDLSIVLVSAFQAFVLHGWLWDRRG